MAPAVSVSACVGYDVARKGAGARASTISGAGSNRRSAARFPECSVVKRLGAPKLAAEGRARVEVVVQLVVASRT